jgi:hypothetical protein
MLKNGDESIGLLRVWSRSLGWKSRLRAYRHWAGRDAKRRLGVEVVRWYECGQSTGGRFDCFLQINEYGRPHAEQYEAAVYAIRFRLCTGWHRFRLFGDQEKLKREADRLADWLDWKWFGSIDGRRQFRQTHPECTGYSWAKLRRDGPPLELHR